MTSHNANALGHMDDFLLIFKSTLLAFHICDILLSLCLHRYHFRSDHIVRTSNELQPSHQTFETISEHLKTQKTTKETKTRLELTEYSLK